MGTADATRRSVVLIAAGLAAATVIAAQPVACTDPILAVIDAHKEAVALTDTEHAKLTAAGHGPDADTDAMGAAIMAEWQAAKMMMATTPSTQAGREALAQWLTEGRSRIARYAVS